MSPSIIPDAVDVAPAPASASASGFALASASVAAVAVAVPVDAMDISDSVDLGPPPPTDISAFVDAGELGDEPTGPSAKDYVSDLVIPEDYVATGLNFGSIYSELVYQKDYPNYTFVASDFEALNVTIESEGPYSLDDAGVAVSSIGDITIDTNADVYQYLNQGDLANASIVFRVTDNNNLSDLGSVEFHVAGQDESITDGWEGSVKEVVDNVVGDLLGPFAVNDVISTTLDTQGNKSNVSFDLYSAGSWDSEDFVVKTENDVIFKQSFQASKPFSGTNEGISIIDGNAFEWSLVSNGREHIGLGKFTQKVAVEIGIPSGLQDIDLTLTSNVDGGVNDESWAVNNFKFNIEPSLSLDQRHKDFTGGDFLKLGYALKGNDNTGNPGGEASSLGVDSSGLTNVAVLGPNTSNNKTYTLEISAESIDKTWNLESADIVLKYDTQLFEKIDFDDIQIGKGLTIANAVDIDDDNGLIRIAAASLGNLSSGNSIGDEAIFASIKVDFDESYFEDSDRTPDKNGKFTFDGNPLGFELSANSDETVFSRTFSSDADGNAVDGGTFTNREIQSLGDLNGNTIFDEGKVNLYQAEIKFEEQGDGLILGTERVIGFDTGFTNLIRKGDLVTAKTNIENIGNSLAKDILIEDAGNVDGASFAGSRFISKTSNKEVTDLNADSKVNLKGGEFKSELANTLDPNIFSTSFIADLETSPEVTDLVNLYDHASIHAGDTASTSPLSNIYAAFDMATVGTNDNILLIDGKVTTNADLTAHIRANLQTNNVFAAGDAFLAAYSDGENSYLVSVSSPSNVADDALLNMADISTVATLNGVSDVSAIKDKDGAFAGIINDAQPIDYPYDPSTQESTEIEIDVRITGDAGDVVDLTKGLFKVSAEDTEQNPDPEDKYYTSNKGSKNLITFQGDLNYDGRVSMKDLAFLNAGAARQQLVDGTATDGKAVQVASADSYARDVDADFNGRIDLADLSVLDQDWGQSLHDGTSGGFTGSSETFTMDDLNAQGAETWDNTSFTNQNAIEAEDAYIGSLEGPGASGVIGADGNTTANDNDITGTEFQDSIPV